MGRRLDGAGNGRSQQLPAEIAKYALSTREANRNPDGTSIVTIGIEHLHPFYAVFTKLRDGWELRKFFTNRKTVTGGEIDRYYDPEYKPNELHLCLAEVATLTKWRHQRQTMALDYDGGRCRVAATAAATAIHEAIAHTLQEQVCEHYGDSFGLWRPLSYFEDSTTDTAVVLENETDPLGFWRVVEQGGAGAPHRLHQCICRRRPGRLAGDQKGIYPPPLQPDAGHHLPAAVHSRNRFPQPGRCCAWPKLTPQSYPKSHGRTAWQRPSCLKSRELDWLYHNTGGDADD